MKTTTPTAPDPTTTKLLAELQGLYRAVAPELATPLYLLSFADLPKGFNSRDSLAYWGPDLDIAVAARLRKRHQWQGRGFAVAFNTPSLRLRVELDAGGDEAFEARLYRGRLFAVAAHELAHLVLAEPPDTLSSPSKLDETLAAAEIHCWAKVKHAPPAAPWFAHGAAWLRTLCHVVFRAEQLLGERLPSRWVADHVLYGLSSFRVYENALGTETADRAGSSFEAIWSEAPPLEFVELWRADLWGWFRSISEPSEEAIKAVASGLRLFSQELIE